MACQCAQNWSLELVSLRTGETISTIVPESFEFTTGFMTPGRGSVTFNMQGTVTPLSNKAAFFSQNLNAVTLLDAYAGDSAIVISRVQGGAATWQNPVHMFVGIIDSPVSLSSGNLTLGLTEITDYLDHRVLRDSAIFTAIDQREIASSLVTYIAEGTFATGGPVLDTEWVANTNSRIFGDFSTNPPDVLRDRTYEGEDRPVVGELIRNLTQVINGPVYRVEPSRDANGVWSFTLKFYNQAEFDGLFLTPTITWDDVIDARLSLPRRDRATLVEVFGSQPDAGSQQIITRTLEDADVDLANARSGYVRHDVTTTYDSDTVSVLEEFGDGVILDRFDNAGLVSLDFAGIEYGTGPASTLNLDDFEPGALVNILLRDQHLPWDFGAGPDIVNTEGPPALSADDLRFGQVSVSAPAEGVEQVNVQAVTSKPFLPITYGIFL